ncbi:MAG TPA: DUF4382 domain-containing protein [Draconibacterium sp.]|nr:DUF4382 domain-containing protein [Draconibacterium sp.]
MKKTRFWGILLPVLIGLIVFSCEKSADDQMLKNKKTGVLTVKITDAPFPSDLVEEANITIDMITIKKSDLNNSESDTSSMSDTTAFIVLSEDTQTINLMELSNGTTAVLTTAELPEGNYSEIRLHVIDASIKLKDGREFPLKVPSGNASGLKIKINPTLEITSGMSGEILLDFDVSRSFILAGNEHSKNVKFMFKPVVRCVNTTVITSGINGVVTSVIDSVTTDSISDASVYLLSGTDTITSALSSEKGYYEMLGIIPATYSVVCTHDGYDTLAVDNVTIARGEILKQNLVLVKDTTSQQ